MAALGRILDIESPTAALVFCRTRDEVDQLTETLNGRGYRAEGLHGGMDQPQRDRVMGRLRSGNAELLVATDVAARGLDVEHLSHVVNFDVPSAPESYVHRIGRVGRGGREGVAITIAEPREQRLLKTIERALKQKIQVAKIPTSTELRAKRLELTRAALYEVCLDDDLDAYRVVFDSLTDDFDVVQVGLAAIKLAHKNSMPEAEGEDIPQPEVSSRRDRPQGRTTKDRADRKPRRERGAPGGADGRAAGRPGPRRGSKGVERVFVSAGRDAGVRPQDLVGAIANETGLSGRDIGSIQVSDRFAIVEVPSGAAREVITALNRTRLKGNRVKARRDKF